MLASTFGRFRLYRLRGQKIWLEVILNQTKPQKWSLRNLKKVKFVTEREWKVKFSEALKTMSNLNAKFRKNFRKPINSHPNICKPSQLLLPIDQDLIFRRLFLNCRLISNNSGI